MGRRTRVEEFCMNSEAARRLRAAPQGCGTCWGLLHYKDKPCTRPAVPYTRLQEWETHEWLSLCDNDCSTQRRGNGQRSLLWMGSIECMSVYVRTWERAREYTEKLLRNVRIHARDKEFESHSMEPYPSRLLWRNITIPSKGLACEPLWMELMEVLCTGLSPLEELNWWDEISSRSWISSDSRREM